MVAPLTSRGADPLAHIFQDSMVLQREAPVPIWGWTAPNSDVEVAFGGQTKHAHADAAGYWKAVLDAMPASRENRDLSVKAGGATTTRQNVLVGEVWIAAGQSNMVVGGPDIDTGVYPFYVSPAGPAKAEIRIRRFGSGVAMEPLADSLLPERSDTPWATFPENQPIKEANIPPYFARVIRDALNVPVGLIEIAVPGTDQAAWISKESLQSFPAEGGGANFYESFLAAQEAKAAVSKEPYKSIAALLQAEDAWEKAPVGARPSPSLEFMDYPTALYNSRVHPLAPYAIRGVIWHQGEAGPGGPYGQRLVAMFNQWRKLFGQDFYVIFGTLGRNTAEPPPLAPVRTSFYRSLTNVEIRKAADLFGPNNKAALVEFYDLGNDVTHFGEKAQCGRRMGMAALSLAYGQPHIFSGPRLIDSKIEGGKVTAHFTQAGTGIAFKPSIDGISGVYLKGKTGAPVWAQVKVIDATTVEFSSPGISDVQMLAYGDNNNPHETLFNSDGLPASPFTVGTMSSTDPAPPATLVALSAKTPGVGLHVAHVRADGYVFEIHGKAKQGDAPDKVSVIAYVPTAWQQCEVLVAGAKTPVQEAKMNGHRFVTFDAPVAGGWIIVAPADKADEFRKVNRF